MAPVIRISDEVFRKLQLLSEPLVDTPSTVIERLVDKTLSPEAVDTSNSVIERLVNQAVPQRAERMLLQVRAVPQAHGITGARSQGVFLAPASEENIKTTISRAVPLSAVEQRLDPKTLEKLRTSLGGKSAFHCWAMTASSRGSYDNMQNGDLVLFTPKGTGRFTYRGIVTGKIESQTLGDIL